MSLLTACDITFKRPKLLQESIESLITQTSKDFDILILNNGNDEDTKNVINFYKKRNTINCYKPMNQFQFHKEI